MPTCRASTKTIWILGDQLSPEHAALAASDPKEARVLMVESKARGSVMKYHQVKLVLVYSANDARRLDNETTDCTDDTG